MEGQAQETLRWVNTPLVTAPQQDRSRRTLERLLDATEEIIRAAGLDAVTIPAVTRAARSSVGSFYARFPDKASLLETLHERACEQSIATATEALDPARWEGVPTADVLRSFVAFSVHLFSARRPMMLAFTSEYSRDVRFAERRARAAAIVGQKLQRLLAGRRDDLGHPNPELAGDIALRLVTGALEQRNALDVGGLPAVRIDDETLIAELSRAVLAYLGVKPAVAQRA